MSTEIIMALIGIASASISSFLTWLFNKKKQDVETEHTTIGNLQDSLEFYKTFSEDANKRLQDALEDRQNLYRKLEEQGKEIAEIKTEMMKILAKVCYNLECKYSQFIKKSVYEQFLNCSLTHKLCLHQKFCNISNKVKNTNDYKNCCILKKREENNER